MSSAIQEQIETRLAQAEPDVEVLTAELVGTGTVRVFIDHPEGVTLALCERVTHHLAEVREQYALEVSSPGPKRPLTKPQHFRRFIGRRVRVRTREKLEGRSNFTGRIAGADDSGVEVDLDEGAVRIPHERIRRSNLVPEFPEGATS